MAGIDSIVNNLVRTFAGNPQGLQDRYAITQELFDLIAMQKVKKDKEAAQRSLQMQMQPESGTVKDQLEGELMQATKQELASSLAPGLQQQGQMMQAQQMQKAMSGGLPTQPAPNMAYMARGGIVGYKEGDLVGGRRPPPAGAYATAEILQALPEEVLAQFTPEELAKFMAYQNANPERRRQLEESPEAMLARTMGTPGDRDVQSVRTMPEDSSRPSRLMDDLGAAAIAEGGMGVPEVGAGLRGLLARMTTQSPEDQQRARDVFAASDAPLSVSEMREPQARLPSLPDVPSLYELLGGNPQVVADIRARRAAAEEAGRPATANAGTTATTPSGAGTAPTPTTRPRTTGGMSAEEAAMQAARYQATDEDLRSMMGEDLSPMQRAESAEPFRSRYADRLAALEGEKTDKLGALIDFLQAAGASGGTNLGATLLGGGSGLQAREARLKAEEMGLLDLMTAEEQAQLDRDFRERELQQRGEISREEIASRSDVLEKEWAIRSNIEAAKDRNEALALGMQNITIHPAYLIAAEKYKEDNDRLFGGPSDAQLEVGADAAGRNAALPYIKSEIDAIFGPSATSSSMPADVAGIVDQYADK